MNSKRLALVSLVVLGGVVSGCGSSPAPVESASSPAASSPAAATPKAAEKPSSTGIAGVIGVTPEQLQKITDEKASGAAVAKLTNETCQTYKTGGELIDVIMQQEGASTPVTEPLTPEKKLFFGALASVAGEKIAQSCPEYTDEFNADVKALLGS